jgi:hypothetical protein
VARDLSHAPLYVFLKCFVFEVGAELSDEMREQSISSAAVVRCRSGEPALFYSPLLRFERGEVSDSTFCIYDGSLTDTDEMKITPSCPI